MTHKDLPKWKLPVLDPIYEELSNRLLSKFDPIFLEYAREKVRTIDDDKTYSYDILASVSEEFENVFRKTDFYDSIQKFKKKMDEHWIVVEQFKPYFVMKRVIEGHD